MLMLLLVVIDLYTIAIYCSDARVARRIMWSVTRQTDVLATVKFPVRLRPGAVRVPWLDRRSQRSLLPSRLRKMSLALPLPKKIRARTVDHLQRMVGEVLWQRDQRRERREVTMILLFNKRLLNFMAIDMVLIGELR